MKKLLKKLLILPICLSMLITYPQTAGFEVNAESSPGNVGTINGKMYNDLDDLFDDLSDMKNRTVTVEMNCNWQGSADGWSDHRMDIPKGSIVTFNMNGHIFDRKIASDHDWESNGESIIVRSGATLIVNGGDTSERHTVGVFKGNSGSDEKTSNTTIYGAVIAGGSSANGAGGIHTEDNVTVTLNNVTIAGCRAECPWYDSAGTNSGSGGGIWIKGEKTTIKMNSSTITGCHAQMSGGGIYETNYNNVHIEMVDSHIDKNYSRGHGGGLELRGEKLVIKGDGNSTISGNVAADKGGGLYLWNDEVTVSSITFDGNKADQGGAIFTQEETISFLDLIITNNSASEGGGIYVNNDVTTIANCTITGNKASKNGGGVFATDNNSDPVDSKFNITGTTVIKNNTKGSDDSNLTLEDGSVRAMFSLTRNADVHLGYKTYPDKWYYVTEGKNGDKIKNSNCVRYMTPDNHNFHITFNESPDSRKIFYVKDGKDESGTGKEYETAKDPTEVKVKDAGSNVVNRVDNKGNQNNNGDYALIKGYLHHEKTDSSTVDTDHIFYYSDGLFFSDPYEYNDHLASMSWNLTFGGTYLRSGAGDLESYRYKHTGARQFLADIGVPDQNIYVNDNNVNKPGTDSIGVIIGSKTLQTYDGSDYHDTDYVLIPVAVRGGGYESEWASNVTLGSGTERNGEAQGFSQAADQVMESIEYYIAKYDLQDKIKEGKVKFWVCGFSRAGATANITSKRLIEKYANRGSDEQGLNNQVFGYPCEAAKGGTDNAQTLSDENYYSIHNLINAADLVPFVGPEEMGFKRYGVDHYIPGTAASEPAKKVKEVGNGGSSGIQEVTTYCDNDPLYTKTDDYNTKRTQMTSHLLTIDSGMTFDDYFHPRALDFIPIHTYETGDYDGNIVENYLKAFVDFLQESGQVKNGNEVLYYWNNITGRDKWAEKKLELDGKTFSTIQDAARDTSALLFSISDEDSAGFIEKASAITDSISYIGGDVSLFELWRDVIGSWNELPSESKKLYYINFFWEKIEDSGALRYLSEEDAAKLEKNWPTLADLIMNIVEGDRRTQPAFRGKYKWATGSKDTMLYIGTMMSFSNYILGNHYPETNIAWTHTYDSWYSYSNGEPRDETEYSVDWTSWNDSWTTSDDIDREGADGYTIDAPSAMVRASSSSDPANDDGQTAGNGKYAYTGLIEGDAGKTASENKLSGDQKIYLEVGNIYDDVAASSTDDVIGEAIYYDLYDITSGEDQIEDEQIYRGGVDLSLGESGSSKKYKIVSYAMSYGIRSDDATYYIDLGSDKHDVTVKTNVDDSSETNTYTEGDNVTIAAKTYGDRYFTGWTVTVNGTGDADGSDVTGKLLGSGDESTASDITVSFKMPNAGTVDGDISWPDDYSLTFTAKYKDKISLITAALNAPEAGKALDNTAGVEFDNSDATLTPAVTWTYVNDKGDNVVQQSGTAAYKNTVYTAVITIPQDADNDIYFAEKVAAKLKDSDIKVDVRRNAADGSVSLIIKFDATGDEEGEDQPTSFVNLEIIPVDPNLGEMTDYDFSIQAEKGKGATISAPAVTNEKFTKWITSETISGKEYTSDIEVTSDDVSKATVNINIPEEPENDELKIYAYYVPVLNQVTATINAPEAGKPLPSDFTLELKITNDFTVDPSNAELIWSPASSDGNAAYLTAYTATVRLKPETDGENAGKIKVKLNGTDTERWVDPSEVVFADTMTVQFKIGDKTVDATYDTKNMSMSTTFEPILYNVKAIKNPEPLTATNDKNSADKVKSLLNEKQPTVSIILDDGREVQVPVTWGTPVKTSGSDDPLESAVWTVEGTVSEEALKAVNAENRDGIELKVTTTVSVSEADTVSAPKASVDSGTYLANQMVALSCRTDGAVIRYTTDDSDPATSETARIYDGEQIIIDRSKYPDGMTIRAIASKDGMRSSGESVYIYEFTNNVEVPVGETLVYSGDPQTGVSAGLFYTLEPESDGVTIDENGNAVATKAGTYKVRAKIADGFNWIIKDADGSEDYTTEDQIIEFTISKKPVYTLTFELNGGTLEGETGTYTMTAEEGTVITMPEPTKDGSTFRYWKGSKYKAGDKYTVTEDHTFAAIWKDSGSGSDTDGSGSGSNGAKTGDSSHILMWAVMFTAALLALLLAMIVRRRRQGM